MTVEVFNHLKANKETAKFFATEIGPIICDGNTCKSCPMAFDVKLEANGITTGCAMGLLCTELMSPLELEIVKATTAIIDLFN